MHWNPIGELKIPVVGFNWRVKGSYDEWHHTKCYSKLFCLNVQSLTASIKI